MALPSQFSRRRLSLTATDRDTRSRHVWLPLPSGAGEGTRRLTKLLINVNIEGSLGPVQVLMSPENMVGDLVKTVVGIYVREKRRPLLLETDHRMFDLHYSQFSMECLKVDEKLINLGSRNFYLCKKLTKIATSSFSNDTFPVTKLMYFLL